jgi:Flp pilus assembly protein TadG
MIEFALSFVLLFAFLSGTIQFGYGFYILNRLQNAVRSGARYGAIRSYDSGTSTPSSTYLSAVRNMVVYGSSGTASQSLVPGLAPSHVDVNVTFVNGRPDLVRVSIQNFQLDALIAKIPLNGKPFAAFRYEGRLASP